MIHIKQLNIDVEKSLSINYNSVRLRMGIVGELEGSSSEEVEGIITTLKGFLESQLDEHLLKSMQALPRLHKKAKDLGDDIPF